MKNIQVYERAILVANYIVEKNATVRLAAKEFGVSKSTVHVGVTQRLVETPKLKKEVEKVLTKNKNESYIRGGEATRQKYLNDKK